MSRTLTLPNLFLSPDNRPSRTSVAAVKVPPTRRNVSVTAFAVTEAPRRTTRSLYEVLRVKRNASLTEIKTAYRTLAKLYHPDAADPGSDGLNFIAIHDAYATLSDPASRELYDLSLGFRCRRIGSSSDSPASFGFYPTRRWETDQCW